MLSNCLRMGWLLILLDALEENKFCKILTNGERPYLIRLKVGNWELVNCSLIPVSIFCPSEPRRIVNLWIFNNGIFSKNSVTKIQIASPLAIVLEHGQHGPKFLIVFLTTWLWIKVWYFQIFLVFQFSYICPAAVWMVPILGCESHRNAGLAILHTIFTFVWPYDETTKVSPTKIPI